MSIKVVYNVCYGGFGLSDCAFDLYNEKRTNANLLPVKFSFEIDRSDPYLVEVVEELRSKANGRHAVLAIENIPSEYASCYHIAEYDGSENVICYPGKLLMEKLLKIDIPNTSDKQCRSVLEELIAIAQK
jgi:hypothetical protein